MNTKVLSRSLTVVSLAGAALCLGRPSLPGAPVGFSVEPYLSGMGSVTAIAFAPDGTLFITEKTGRLSVVPPGSTTRKTFATLAVYSSSECGLLGVALDPNYPGYGKDGYVYVFATVSNSEQRIIRFRDAQGVGADRKDVRTGLPTLGANHDGGSLKVGPDGKFYLAIGEGGSGSQKSQDVTNLFGKVIRLNLDGTAPADNPDLSAVSPSYRHEIFAYGFRNPFRVVLRPNSSVPQGFQVFVNDVGSANTLRREEVNLVLPGKNYGWPNVEGIVQNPLYANPIWAYNAEGNCITGGVFYQGSLFPAEYRGNYFFMDYGSNRIFRMILDGDARAANPTTFHQSAGGLIDIAEGPEGALYFTTNSGQISRIVYETPGNQKPTAVLAALPLSGRAPLPVSFDAGDSTDADGTIVRYDWDFGDGPALLNGGPTQDHLYAADGTYTARVTVTDSSGGTARATATIQVNYVPILLHSEPTGLRLTANGVSLLAPAEYLSAIGASVEVGAPSPQAVNQPLGGAGPYLFDRWSDNGDQTHSLITREGVVVTAFFAPDPKAVFIRGDCNRDAQVDVSDAVFSLTALFMEGKPWACPDAGDANDDGKLDIADPIAILFALFGGGRVLPPPSIPGFDPTDSDPLGCEREGAG